MNELLSKVLPLSLGAAVSPTVLAGIVLVLGGRRSIARGTAFALGVLTVLAALTVGGLLVSHQSHPSATQIQVTHDVYGLLGIVLLSLAVISLLRSRTHSDTGTPVHTSDPKSDTGIAATYALGFGLMISNLSTIVLYLPAMHSVSESTAGNSAKVIAVVLALAITSIPVTAPLLLRVGLPRRSVPIFAAINGFVTNHQRAITLTIEVAFGFYLLYRAL
jgi:hypothetical protein